MHEASCVHSCQNQFGKKGNDDSKADVGHMFALTCDKHISNGSPNVCQRRYDVRCVYIGIICKTIIIPCWNLEKITKNLTLQEQVPHFNQRIIVRDPSSIPLKLIYMTDHYPGLVQALQWKIAGLNYLYGSIS